MSESDLASCFGMGVRYLRQLQGITAASLAERAGLSKSFISDVENGKRSVSLFNAVKIAGALGVEVSRLIAKPRGKQV